MAGYCLRAAVCDDQAEDLETVISMARRIASQEGFSLELSAFSSSRALMNAIRDDGQHHLLMLDVMMDGMNSMGLAAARFLGKPLQEDKLREALLFCYQDGKAQQELALPTPRGMRRLSASEIVYAETHGRGVMLTLTDGREEISMYGGIPTLAVLPSAKEIRKQTGRKSRRPETGRRE